jgi:DSF synthase
MGVVDVLAKDGTGETVVREWIAKSWKRRNGLQAVMRARQLVHPIQRDELDAIAEVWVDAALRVEDKDLKMMSRIVRSQMRRMESGEAIDVTAEAVAAAL